MLPEFMRRLLRKHETAKVDDEPPQSGGEASVFVRELAAENTGSLGKILTRFDKVMIATARQLTRRYHVRGVFVEYTAQEIADLIGAGVRTVERCLGEIRGIYTRRGWDNDAIQRVLARAGE